VHLELRLRNRGSEPVTLPTRLDPGDASLEIGITDPTGVRRPYLPLATSLPDGASAFDPGSAVYDDVQLTLGRLGCAFALPGPHAVDVVFRTPRGAASDRLGIYVNPPRGDDGSVVQELFDPRVARVLQFEGSRFLEEENDKLRWVLDRLGPGHPAAFALRATLALPLVSDFARLRPGERHLRLERADPERAKAILRGAVDEPDRAAASLGHVRFARVLHRYLACAEACGERQRADARRRVAAAAKLLRERGVLEPVVAALEERAHERL